MISWPLLTVALIGLIGMGRLRHGRWTLSIILAAAFGAVAALAPLLAPRVAILAGPAGPLWRPDLVSSGCTVFLLAGIGSAVGASLVSMAPRNPVPVTPSPSPWIARRARGATRSLSSGPAMAFAWLVAIAWTVARGPAYLWYRPTYISETLFPPVVVALGPLLPVAFAIGIYTWRESRRLAGLALVCTLTVVILATTSRLLALFPLIYLMIRIQEGNARRRTYWIAAVLSILGLCLVIGFRQTPGAHGLWSYLQRIDLLVIWTGIYESLGNILVSVPLAGYVREYGQITTSDMWVSLAPLPGSLSDWDALAPSLRVHEFIPYNGLGELASYSGAALVAFYALFTSTAERALHRARAHSTYAGAAIGALILLTLVLQLQYNLRSSSRLAWILAAALLLLTFIRLRTQARQKTTRMRNVARPPLDKRGSSGTLAQKDHHSRGQ